MRALLAILLLGACSNDFDPPSLVTGLRVLAIQAEPPELAPGQTTTLTILRAGPLPDGTTFHWDWCQKPLQTGQSGTINPDCVQNQTADYLVPIGDGEQIQFTMPDVAFDKGQLGLPDATLGLYLPLRVWISFPGDAAPLNQNPLKVFYRLRLHIAQFTANGQTIVNPSKPNQNPGLSGIFQEIGPDGGMTDLQLDENGVLEAKAGSKVTLRTYVTAGSDEPYLALSGDPSSMMLMPQTEEPRFFWYAAAGRYSEDVTGEPKPDTELDLGDGKHYAPTGEPFDIWVVVHEERGGVAWKHAQIVAK